MSTATTDNNAVREHAVRKELFVDGYEVVIGIEIHCQLNTESKIFSSAPTDFGHEPNSQASIVDLGLPGVLPVLNAGVVDRALKFGIGVNAELGLFNTFDRKNYFYPDLPKGYQITQMANPIVGEGYIDVVVNEGEKNEYPKRMGITRAHLEEDAGKSVHDAVDGMTGVDLNRAGTPLIEIVSEPDMRSAHEALAYIKAIHQLVTWLGISDAVMAEGSFRCDCNVSVRKPGADLGTRTELKNLNSFRFIERAINREIERQIDILEDGGKVVQATMLYDPERDETRTMRTKEDANDYRYFPDPDLLPVRIEQHTVDAIKAAMPELPVARRARFEEALGLSEYDARILTGSRQIADYFEDVVAEIGQQDAKMAGNWVMGDLLGALNKDDTDIIDSPISAKQLAGMLKRIKDDTLSGKLAKKVFSALYEREGGDGDDAADKIIKDKGLKQETDTGAIKAMVEEVIAKNEAMVEEYRGGKEKAFNGLVGQVMKASRGSANPQQVNQILKELLG
ncbi:MULTISPECIES: Asp-tRNA(Asn)/Glu-tRNA(Gln) amidotransferase subunit GatB [Psychrobacter]|jgi:aspartyl-tRNA(Asn)/glutamyl-tRNA(Gln) amidotransferase subunit B|uniref:Asp-tRNA(Asn)/Glu-tRNA(Gln) amidotransferase subunit GatB n=1 Tax=Psychrobacter TaxID=497 RepID=UPI00043210DB|nr:MULTISPECIES: Asp-tRNA(Asn)/Glu-tRNA(Gln) amidotransferase subunit GatB [unclassified Psychrobacter]MDN3448120.1 Asp-tRNA(Asn)/Glu-tRNA(Gln) amidotransferase subunit GatB [Psychrobacter sp. APC 3281]PKH78368.1 Asp-tRNA(Asn)/Glu-tRNA(Gln) amidotransferase GatCAB subunit B [Psychrobacter sp. 4Bb]QOD13198.1 Asp-tRNA(Asn)/Glu-tRNA(Gln) amidotransferase subunit GatB [Psychrobacter sp. 28M-43]GAF53754.1 aspartyl-tRNA(Asn) amidotransferase subunit B [Psychrobacter sp. JCM 18900]